MSRGDQGVKRGTAIAGIPEMLFDALHVPRSVAVIRGRRIVVTVGNADVYVVNRWCNPDSGQAHSATGGNFLLDGGEAAVTIELPVCFGGSEDAGTLPRDVA